MTVLLIFVYSILLVLDFPSYLKYDEVPIQNCIARDHLQISLLLLSEFKGTVRIEVN